MEEEDVDEKRIEQDRQITGGNAEGVKVEKLREHHAENEKEDPQSAETLHHGTENKAPRVLTDGEKGAVAAKTHSRDIYPTSPSSDKEAFLSSTDASHQTAAAHSVTDTNVPCADAHLNLSEQTETSQRSLQEQERHPGERAGVEEADNSGNTPPVLHTDLQTSLCRPEDKVTLMEAPAQSSMEDEQESKISSGTVKHPMKTVRSPVMNGEADAADDKKKDGQQSSKYKTVSYRKIPRGNTRQRIDEFESMFNS
ncbi:ermin [Astatotilapia calliptera]|uniref:ermin n=1 Tax=Astatotilapia calliptera TaxID=8154 RepID=UPI000E4082A4|nr:ermin [Astatotilapia calliptera]